MPLPQGGQGGFFGARSVISFTLTVSFVQARFLSVRRSGYVPEDLIPSGGALAPYDSYGPKGGAVKENMGSLGDDGSEYDAGLNRNRWTGDSLAYNFPFLDNLEPVAPMDRLDNGNGPHQMDPVYVPKYLNPEVFPNRKLSAGDRCKCQMPNSVPIGQPLTTTVQQQAPFPWRPPKDGLSGVPPAPTTTTTANGIKCECDKKQTNGHQTWMKSEAIAGTNEFNLAPADLSYSAGNYWSPDLRHRDEDYRGGVVAPADSLAARNYPNQAPADKIWPLPATGVAEKMGIKFARYMDQNAARMDECGPTDATERCTTPCKPGDPVTVEQDNLRYHAKVTRTMLQDIVLATFVPEAAKASPPPPMAGDCPYELSCSPLRVCKNQQKQTCVEIEATKTHNWQKQLVETYACPEGTQLCSTIEKLYTATSLKKDGKNCKAEPGDAPDRSTTTPGPVPTTTTGTAVGMPLPSVNSNAAVVPPGWKYAAVPDVFAPKPPNRNLPPLLGPVPPPPTTTMPAAPIVEAADTQYRFIR